MQCNNSVVIETVVGCVAASNNGFGRIGFSNEQVQSLFSAGPHATLAIFEQTPDHILRQAMPGRVTFYAAIRKQPEEFAVYADPHRAAPVCHKRAHTGVLS